MHPKINTRALDVYVDDILVAHLVKEGSQYSLTYIHGTDPANFVSLSMPVRAASWVSVGKLHPFFEMNLPEGSRREVIAKTFGKAMLAEEMSLLALTGNDTIGRVKVVPSGLALNWKESFKTQIPDPANISDIDAFFREALEKYSAQGVSGVQPKLLMSNERITLKNEDFILKYDNQNFLNLSRNEFLSMMAAKRSGLDVPECTLHHSGKALFVRRFDKDVKGFEDFCSLMGLSPVEKYSGSFERLVKTALLVTNSDKQKMKEDLLKSVILNTCIGNSDAHLKNFGVLYNDKVTLAPFFDIVSVKAFPEFGKDIPSLSLGGKKEWTIGKAFHTFAATMGIPKRRVDELIADVEKGIKETMKDVAAMMQHTEFREHGKAMLCLWDTGLRRIHGEKINDEIQDVLSNQGFSPLQKSEAFKPVRTPAMGADFKTNHY